MKVSIITPVYNAERFLEQTIISVLNQTYKDWEMLLIDDCSIDNSKNIIKKFQNTDSRIRYIKLDKNSGAAVARNIGIENAQGRFIAFLDSDDLWEHNKLEIQLDFMLKNNIGFSFTSYQTMTEEGSLTGKTVRVCSCIDYEGLLKDTIIGCLTVVIDRDIIGDFRMPNLKRRQDFATWLMILKQGNKAYGLDISLAKYRLVTGSLSNNKVKASKQNWYVYRTVEKLSLVKSMYVFSCYAFNAIKKRI